LKRTIYVDIANKRLKTIVPISNEFLNYNIEKRKPKVSFGSLIEKGYIKIGEDLYSKI